MRNDFLDYYGEHRISPVKQDVGNIEVHYERRKKLYMQCGIPTITFRNAEVLEVGPGGGYNTLAFFHWNTNHVDLVEPNTWGRKDINNLFAEQNISKDKYEVFPCTIEDYQTDKKYDIIVAEGFLQNLYNKEEVIHKLQGLVNKNGIVVITCTDHVCFFVELMKRLVGMALAADIQEYEQKVDYLANLFAPQLAKLRGVSRSAKEWVQDQILDTPNVNGTELSISQAIDYFSDGFEVLGCSPRMLTDYSWYKDIWYDCKKDYKEQFDRKRLSLLLANMPEVVVPMEQADILVKHFENIKKIEFEYEETLDVEKITNILKEMDSMENLIKQSFNNEFINVFSEIKEVLLCCQRKEKIDMENYPSFFAAFGRTQQYISFERK